MRSEKGGEPGVANRDSPSAVDARSSIRGSPPGIHMLHLAAIGVTVSPRPCTFGCVRVRARGRTASPSESRARVPFVSVSRRNRPTLPAELRAKPEHAPISVRRALRERVRGTAENRPGVYRMLSEGGTVLYVGKSKSLRSRLLHLNPMTTMRWNQNLISRTMG